MDSSDESWRLASHGESRASVLATRLNSRALDTSASISGTFRRRGHCGCCSTLVFLRAQSGDFLAFNNSNSYWKLLWVVVERKVARCVEYQLAECRNVNKTVHFSALSIGDSERKSEAGTQQDPRESVALADTLQHFFAQLDGISIQVARLALEGHTPKEIAKALELKVWTIYSHLSFIRKLLEHANVE